MNDVGRRYEFLLSTLVVAVFAAMWLIIVACNDPPEFTEQYVQLAIAWALVTAPWAIAAKLLWRAWWERNGAQFSVMDGPARLLAAAVAGLPEDRRAWGKAMVAELTQVTGRSSRWRFAAGCAGVAIFPPRSSRLPLLTVGALAITAAATAGPIVGDALPALRIFAQTFVALVGAAVTLTVARSKRPGHPKTGLTVSVAGAAGVASCIAVTAYFLVQHPGAAEHFSTNYAMILAAALAGGVWLALTPPRGLTSSRAARVVSAASTLALGIGYLASSRMTVHTNVGPMVWVMLAPWPIFFVGSAAAAVASRSFRAGVQAAVWTALFGTLAVFAMSMPEAMRRYAIDGRTLSDGETGYAIGVNLPDAVRQLIAIPLLGLPVGVIGAAVGNWRLRRPSRKRREREAHAEGAAILLRKPPPLGGAT